MQAWLQLSSLREKVWFGACEGISALSDIPSSTAALPRKLDRDTINSLIVFFTEMFPGERDVWSHSSSASDTRTYSPGPPLTPTELRKMSLLSSISVTIPLDQDFNVRAVSPTGCHLSPEHILPYSGKWFSL